MKGKTDFDSSDAIPVEEEQISTTQEATPLPYVAGTRLVAIRWIDNAADMQAIQTSDQIAKK